MQISLIFLLLVWVINFMVLFFGKQSLPQQQHKKREQEKQQQQRLVAFYSSIPLFMMNIWPNDSFVSLSDVRDNLCLTLFVFPMHSHDLLWVPVHFICIQIGLCWTLLFNCLRSCAFIWPLIGLRQRFVNPVRSQWPKLAFVGHFLALWLRYVQISVSLSVICYSL